MVKSLTRNRAQMQNTNTYHTSGDMAMRRRGGAVENVGMPTLFSGWDEEKEGITTEGTEEPQSARRFWMLRAAVRPVTARADSSLHSR